MISRIFTRSVTKPGAFALQKRTFIRIYQKQTDSAGPCYFTERSYLEACHQHHLDAVNFESARLPSSDEEESSVFSAHFVDYAVEESYQHYKPPRRKRSHKVTKP